MRQLRGNFQSRVDPEDAPAPGIGDDDPVGYDWLVRTIKDLEGVSDSDLKPRGTKFVAAMSERLATYGRSAHVTARQMEYAAALWDTHCTLAYGSTAADCRPSEGDEVSWEDI